MNGTSDYSNTPTSAEEIAAIANNIVSKIEEMDDYDLNPGMLLILVQSKQIVREVKLVASSRLGERWIHMPVYTLNSFCTNLLRNNYRRLNARYYEQRQEVKQATAAGEDVDIEEEMGYPLYDEFRIIDSYNDAGYNRFCTYGVTQEDLVNNTCNLIEDYVDLNYQYLYVIDQNCNVYKLDDNAPQGDFLINALVEIEARYTDRWEQLIASRKLFEE